MSLLAGGALIVSREAYAAWGPASPGTEGADVELEFGNGAAQGIPVHAELPCGLALVATVFLQDGQDEPLLEFAHGLGIEDSALMHLKDECFQLVFHSAPLADWLGTAAVPKFRF